MHAFIIVFFIFASCMQVILYMSNILKVLVTVAYLNLVKGEVSVFQEVVSVLMAILVLTVSSHHVHQVRDELDA